MRLLCALPFNEKQYVDAMTAVYKCDTRLHNIQMHIERNKILFLYLSLVLVMIHLQHLLAVEMHLQCMVRIVSCLQEDFRDRQRRNTRKNTNIFMQDVSGFAMSEVIKLNDNNRI